MHKNNELYICKICGLIQADPPWGLDGMSPSFNICPCCGVEFGYEDCLLLAIRKYRENWLLAGALWLEPNKKPPNYSLSESLSNIPSSLF